jgi:MFS-type transporter involved in bile tolerance (Atg22 family)
MASNDLGPAPQMVGAAAEDTIKGDVAVRNSSGELVVEDGKPIAPDQFEPKYETGKYELWAYYSYYIGNNVSEQRLQIVCYQLLTKSTQGLHLFNFAPTASQNLLAQHAAKIGGPDNEIVYFAGSNRTTNSIILLCNGISFAIQIAILLLIGAYADFGSFRPNILIVLSLIAFGIGFGWLGVHEEDQWQTGLGLYIVGLIAYQLCLTYWTAAFPGLARNTRALREQARKYEDGEVTREEYEFTDSMKRNEISNQAFYIQSLGEIVILAVIVGIMFGLRVNKSEERNNWGLSVLIAFASGVWLLLAVPWFVLEKRRPGQDPGMNIVVAGFWQLYRAVTQIWQLKQSLFYLIGKFDNLVLSPKHDHFLTGFPGYFLLGDSLNTTVTVIGTLQNSIVAYNTLDLTYLLIVGIAAQAVGIFGFWHIQKRYRLSTKTMFNAVAVGIILLDAWGMVGISTQKFGFHNVWEGKKTQFSILTDKQIKSLTYLSSQSGPTKPSTASSSAPGTATAKS